MAITKEQVIEIAKQCFDPEIPVNIWDLGLIYDVDVKPEDEVVIRMTLTSMGCPSAQQIPEDLKKKIEGSLHPKKVDVKLVFDPMWTPERITEDGKKKLGIETE